MLKKKNILLIDDDLPTNMLHQFIFKRIDDKHDIKVAQTGIEALEILKSDGFSPDLIFLDINMPAMNGFEFIDAYKTLGKKIPPIVLLTTSQNPSDRDIASEYSEIKLYKNKPLSILMVKEIFEEIFS